MNDRDSSAWCTRDGSSLAAPWLLPTNVIGGPARSTVPTSRLKSGFIPSLNIRSLASFAEMVGCQHFLVVGDRLVSDVDISQHGDEIRQEQEPQPQEIDRDRQDQNQPEHAGKEDDAVPDARTSGC